MSQDAQYGLKILKAFSIKMQLFNLLDAARLVSDELLRIAIRKKLLLCYVVDFKRIKIYIRLSAKHA